MSLIINGVEVEDLIFNGVQAEKAILNGVVVWERANEEVPYLNVEKKIVFLSKINGWEDINQIETNQTFSIN